MSLCHALFRRLISCKLHGRVVLSGVLALTAICAAPAIAQEWPTRPVRVILPFAPGGSSEFLTRVVTDELTKRFKQTFLIDSRPGAGGVIGMEFAARAAPDGYTLGITGIAPLIIAPAMNPATFDPMKSFAHIALFGGAPEMIVLHPSVPVRNIKELLVYAKAQPRGFSYATAGVGTKGHLLGVLFAELSGANIVHIPYKGGGPVITDLVANQVPSAISTVVSVAPLLKAGKIRALGVSSPKRMADFPDVPTFGEEGYPDLLGTSWFAVSGPAGLAPAIVNRLNAEVRRVLASPEVRQKLDPQGIEANDLDPAQFTEYVRTELKRWGTVAARVK